MSRRRPEEFVEELGPAHARDQRAWPWETRPSL